MKRWFWKRWAWAGVFGITAAVGLAMGDGKDASPRPPKVGDVKVLNFEKGPEKKVKVQKVEKQPDGSYLLEVKDTKSGEVFSLLDRTAGGAVEEKAPGKSAAGKQADPKKIPGLKAPVATKTPAAPKAATPTKSSTGEFSPGIRSRFSDSAFEPSTPAATPPANERKLFGSTNRPTAPTTPTAPAAPAIAAAPTPMPQAAQEPEKKPGLLKRIFGSKDKTPPAPAMPAIPAATPAIKPAPSVSAKPTPSFTPSTSVFEPGAGAARPAARPANAAPATGAPKLFPDYPGATGEPRTATPKPTPAFVPSVSRTPEPPRTLPMKPVAPPSPAISAPVTPPSRPPMSAPAPLPIPATPTPKPTPIVPAVPAPSTPAPSTPITPPPVATPSKPATPAPALPVPSAPALPVPSAPATAPAIPTIPSGPSGLPTIPVPPGGVSMSRQPIMQAGFASPAAAALAQDIQPHVTALRTAAAPSMRVLAARALSGGRHASSETVKSILFMACTSDPSGFVRASCIDELCKLGYFDAAFMAHLNKATGDPSEEVRTAAKEALARMAPKK